FAAQPFGNKLVTVTITGADLTGLLEHGITDSGSGVHISEGLVVRVNAKHALTLELNGKPLAPTAAVRVTTHSFLADRDPVLRNGKDRVSGPGDLDALEAYFAAHPKVSPPKKPRIVRAP